MIQLRFVPFDRWPGERTKSRRASPFRANYLSTLDLIEAELRYLRAKDIVVQAGVRWEDLRNDGWPKSGAKWADPGVILTFTTTQQGALSFPCDRYTDWQANLRAIALSLQALRAVDRYGVTKRAEQYQGWRQIEAPGVTPAFSSADQAARFIALQAYGDDRTAHEILGDSQARKKAYRSAAALYHPDVNSGGQETWILLQQALAILDASARGGAGV